VYKMYHKAKSKHEQYSNKLRVFEDKWRSIFKNWFQK
jgi:hypothetical protein